MVADTNDLGGGNGQPHNPNFRPACAAVGEKAVVVFTPQPDITAYEMAKSTEILLYGFAVLIRAAPPEIVDLLYDLLDEPVKRHWTRQEKSQLAVAQKPQGLHLPPGMG